LALPKLVKGKNLTFLKQSFNTAVTLIAHTFIEANMADSSTSYTWTPNGVTDGTYAKYSNLSTLPQSVDLKIGDTIKWTDSNGNTLTTKTITNLTPVGSSGNFMITFSDGSQVENSFLPDTVSITDGTTNKEVYPDPPAATSSGSSNSNNMTSLISLLPSLMQGGLFGGNTAGTAAGGASHVAGQAAVGTDGTEGITSGGGTGTTGSAGTSSTTTSAASSATRSPSLGAEIGAGAEAAGGEFMAYESGKEIAQEGLKPMALLSLYSSYALIHAALPVLAQMGTMFSWLAAKSFVFGLPWAYVIAIALLILGLMTHKGSNQSTSTSANESALQKLNSQIQAVWATGPVLALTVGSLVVGSTTINLTGNLPAYQSVSVPVTALTTAMASATGQTSLTSSLTGTTFVEKGAINADGTVGPDRVVIVTPGGADAQGHALDTVSVYTLKPGYQFEDLTSYIPFFGANGQPNPLAVQAMAMESHTGSMATSSQVTYAQANNAVTLGASAPHPLATIGK
jgi:hypothetical protein